MPSIIALGVAVLGFFAAALIVPAAVALFTEDWLALEALLLIGVTYGFFAAVTLMALTPRLRRLNRAGVFTAAIAMWLMLVAAAIPPFLFIEHLPPLQALFESVSASITLGVTFRPLGQISSAMAVYRGIVAWQGGLLTLLLAVYVIGRSEVGGTSSRHLRYVLHAAQAGEQRLMRTFVEVFVPYTGITLVCAAALVLARLSPEQALNLAINVIATNGFVAVQSGASVLNNLTAEILLLIFMIAGATSILWHRALLARRWRQVLEQNEAQWFFMAILVLCVGSLLSISIAPSGFSQYWAAAFNRIFDAISILTTTGITHHQGFGVSLPFELVLGLAILGGCSYSTAGGLKFFRLGLMMQHSSNEVQRLVYPHIALRDSVDSDPAVLRRIKAVWSAFFLALVAIVVAAILFSTQGYGLVESLALASGTFSATANVVSDALALPTGQTPSAITLSLISALGLFARIEILVVLAALGRSDW